MVISTAFQAVPLMFNPGGGGGLCLAGPWMQQNFCQATDTGIGNSVFICLFNLVYRGV